MKSKPFIYAIQVTTRDGREPIKIGKGRQERVDHFLHHPSHPGYLLFQIECPNDSVAYLAEKMLHDSIGTMRVSRFQWPYEAGNYECISENKYMDNASAIFAQAAGYVAILSNKGINVLFERSYLKEGDPEGHGKREYRTMVEWINNNWLGERIAYERLLAYWDWHPETVPRMFGGLLHHFDTTVTQDESAQLWIEFKTKESILIPV